MFHRWVLGAAIALVSLAAWRANGQTQKPGSSKGVYEVPRTPDGQPDLQGIWTNATLTPLERPRELAGKEFFTEQEAIAWEKKLLDSVNADRARPADNARPDDVIGTYGEVWRERGKVTPTLRTSMIFDPPDGRIPALTAEGRKRAAARAEERKLHGFDGPENRSVRERCLSAINTVPMVAAGSYSSNYQIVQSPGYVMIVGEQVHDARIIPLDGRPHPPQNIRLWLGDSRGHWESTTLVVETTNFKGEGQFADAGEKLKVTERFTRTAPNLIMYEFKMEDPETFTSSWTAQNPLIATAGPVFEYACHEGNYSLTNLLSGARAEERKATTKEKKPQ